MRRSAVFAVCLGIVIAITGCAGGAVDEELLPTRVPTLDPQALALAAEADQAAPEPTATYTPIPPTPEPEPAAAESEVTQPPTVDSSAEETAPTAGITATEDITATTAVTAGQSVEPTSEEPAVGESETISETAPAAETIAQTDSVTETGETFVPAPEPAEPPASDAAGSSAAVDPILAGLPESLLAAIADADPDNGETLTLSVGCIGCHSLDPNQFMAGPTWYDMAQTAAGRAEGESAGLYLYHSIVDPNAYVVEGFLPNIMLQTYKDTLAEDDLADIMAYLLTVRGR